MMEFSKSITKVIQSDQKMTIEDEPQTGDLNQEAEVEIPTETEERVENTAGPQQVNFFVKIVSRVSQMLVQVIFNSFKSCINLV